MRVAACLLALILALLSATSAFAHAEPAKVNPGDGAVVKEMPTVIDIFMTQDMARQADANDIDVLDPTGREITLIAAVIDNNDRKHISVTIPRGTFPPGLYTIKWKTLSADDGDPAEGTLSFTWDPAATTVQPGKVNLKETGPAAAPAGDGAPAATTTNFGGDSGGTSWVLVVAVAVGMFVAGSGTTFLIVQKRT